MCLNSKEKGEITDGLNVLIFRVGDNRSTDPYIFYRLFFKQLTFPVRSNTRTIAIAVHT
jgi:hypothetical protein